MSFSVIVSRQLWLYSIALVAGLLQGLSFDFPFDSNFLWCAPVLSACSLAMLFWLGARPDISPRFAWKVGYLFGLGSFGWGLNWIYISMAEFGGASLIFAVLANITVVMFLSLYWAFAVYAIVRCTAGCKNMHGSSGYNMRLLLIAPVIAVMEWLRSVFLIGFPWLSIGYAWIDTPVAELSAIVGVFGVSFFVVGAIAIVMMRMRFHRKVLSLVCMISLVYGAHTFNRVSDSTVGQPLVASLVQGNLPVLTEYVPSRIRANMKKYQTMTEELVQDTSPDVVIWPESAVPYFFSHYRGFFAKMQELQQRKNFNLITGVPHVKWPEKEFFNSVALQTIDEDKPQFYSKYHLLAFGEYLPFRDVLAFFKEFVDIPMAGFTPGAAVQPSFVVNGVGLSPSICFEVVFGNEIRRNARNGNILLNISNDAWFGRSKVQLQHLNIARMRAIENQRVLIRATNDGLTAVVDRDGRVTTSLPPYTADVLTVSVQGYDTITPYMRWGDWLVAALCCTYFVFLGGFMTMYKRRRGQ